MPIDQQDLARAAKNSNSSTKNLTTPSTKDHPPNKRTTRSLAHSTNHLLQTETTRSQCHPRTLKKVG